MSETRGSQLLLPSSGTVFTTPRKLEGGSRPSSKRSRDNILFSLTQDIIGTYKRCNTGFKAIEVLPQRILTQPSEGVLNNGLDNEDSNLICKVHDTFAMDGYVFTILDLLGTGTFGQVFRCVRSDTKDIVAVKVVKNKPAYHAQGLLEIKIAKLLNQQHDPNDERHIVRLLDSFEFHGHVCLVFELLSVSLLDILTQNQFRGLPLSVIQRFTRQILTALVTMEEADVIHCDLKPENILLVPAHSNPSSPQRKSEHSGSITASGDSTTHRLEAGGDSSADGAGKPASPHRRSAATGGGGGGGISDVKVIDFGSACFEGKTMYSYIQSRFYRSPEVLLGLPYNGAIDMWSLACVCAEMYLGLPLFPGVSQHNQLARIVEMLGLPPDFMLEGKNGRKYFAKVDPPAAAVPVPITAQDAKQDAHFEASPQSVCVGSAGVHSASSASAVAPGSATAGGSAGAGAGGSTGVPAPRYRIKTAEEFATETNTQVPVLRKYLRYSRLDEVIMRCPLPQKARMTPEQKNAETLRRRCFLDFLQGLFRLNPFERWTARQASSHPFIEGSKFVEPYVPPPDMKINERKLNFMVLTQRKPPPSATYDPATMTGLRAPSNFSTVPGLLSANSAQFTPLQLAQRRMSDPGLGRNSARGDAGAASKPTGPQLLKRGAPAHLPTEESPTSPGLTESSIPFSTSFNELPQDDQQETATGDAVRRSAAPVLSAAVALSGNGSESISRTTSDTIGESDHLGERSASDERGIPLPGAHVARAILRVNSRQRDLQGLSAAMQHISPQQQQQHVSVPPHMAGSPTIQPGQQYLSQQLQAQAQYQQFALAQHQHQHMHMQSQSLHASPQSQMYLQQQYRQHQHQHQLQGQPPHHQARQQQLQPQHPGQGWNNMSYPAPPRGYYPPPHQPPPQQQVHPPGATAYPPFGAPISSSMQPAGNTMLGSSLAGTSMGSSYSSYGYVGSMQDSSGVILTDFAQALMRPDMDEQRRLMSQTSQQPLYWQQQMYGSPSSLGAGYGYLQGYVGSDSYQMGAGGGGHVASFQAMHSGGAQYTMPLQGDYPRNQPQSHGYYPPPQPPLHHQQQPLPQQQQAGSYDTKTMFARRRQMEQHAAAQQQLQASGTGVIGRQERNHSVGNLAEMSSAPPPAVPPVPAAVPDVEESRTGNNNNIKRISARMGQNRDSQGGNTRSGLSLLQVGMLPNSNPDVRKPSPAYGGLTDRPDRSDRQRSSPTPPGAAGHTAGIAMAAADDVGSGAALSSSIRITTAMDRHKDTSDRVNVIAGSYVDSSQHTFRLLRPKDGLAVGDAGGSFLAKEIERRESFVTAKHPAVSASAAARPSSPSTGSSSAANSRQNSVDSASSPRHLGLGALQGRRGSPGATTAAAVAGGGTRQRPGKVRRAASKGESGEDVMEEWHPFFEADAI